MGELLTEPVDHQNQYFSNLRKRQARMGCVGLKYAAFGPVKTRRYGMFYCHEPIDPNICVVKRLPASSLKNPLKTGKKRSERVRSRIVEKYLLS